MNKQQIELINRARLALYVAKSTQESKATAWREQCNSDPEKGKTLSVLSRRGKRTAIKDRERIGRMIVPQRIGNGSRALANAEKLGVREPEDGIRYPKAECRSVGKVIRKTDLVNAGFSDDQIASILKLQSSRIRVKRDQVLTRLDCLTDGDAIMSFLRMENSLTEKGINNTLGEQLATVQIEEAGVQMPKLAEAIDETPEIDCTNIFERIRASMQS